MKSSARGVGRLLLKAMTTREGWKGGHQSAATLSPAPEMRKLDGDGTWEKEGIALVRVRFRWRRMVMGKGWW